MILDIEGDRNDKPKTNVEKVLSLTKDAAHVLKPNFGINEAVEVTTKLQNIMNI